MLINSGDGKKHFPQEPPVAFQLWRPPGALGLPCPPTQPHPASPACPSLPPPDCSQLGLELPPQERE